MELSGKLSVYQTIVEQIKKEITLGVYKEGEKLPSCRELALQLAINPNTVQRAYSELEECGYIYTLPKKGVYVGNKVSAVVDLSEFESVARKMFACGVSAEKMIEIVESICKEDKS